MPADMEYVETVIIGGGHAGLTMSYSLGQLGREHVILERGRVGERWRSERWDSFHFQFPNRTIELPGYKYQCDDPDAFAPGHEVVRFLDGYADFINAPVRCGVAVTSLEQASRKGRYLIRAENGTIEAGTVVIATGPFQQPATPAIAAMVPADVFQVHSNNHQNPDQLPAGAILVVGAGSSGCQIAEDLTQSGSGRRCRVYRGIYQDERKTRLTTRAEEAKSFIGWTWRSTEPSTVYLVTPVATNRYTGVAKRPR